MGQSDSGGGWRSLVVIVEWVSEIVAWGGRSLVVIVEWVSEIVAGGGDHLL